MDQLIWHITQNYGNIRYIEIHTKIISVRTARYLICYILNPVKSTSKDASQSEDELSARVIKPT